MTTATTRSTPLIDNDRVRVTRYDFPPGAQTGWHRHSHDYVVVPLANGRLKIVEGGAEKHVDLTVGVPYFRSAGVEHDVINANAQDYAFIEIEIK